MNWTVNTRDKGFAILEAEVYLNGTLISPTTNGVLVVNATLGSSFELKIVPVDPTYRTYIQNFVFDTGTQSLQPITVLFATLTDESPVSNFYIYRHLCSSKIDVYHASACLWTTITWQFGNNKMGAGYTASYSYQAYGQMSIKQTVKTCDVDLDLEDAQCQGIVNLPSNAAAFQVRIDALGIGTPAVLKLITVGNNCATGGLTSFNLALNPFLGINDITDLANAMATTYNLAHPTTFATATVDDNVITFYVAAPESRNTLCLLALTAIPTICSQSSVNKATIMKNWTCNDCNQTGDPVVLPSCTPNVPIYNDGISGEGVLAATFTRDVASETGEVLVMLGSELNCCNSLYEEQPTLAPGDSVTIGMNEAPEITVVIHRHLDGNYYARVVYDSTHVTYNSLSTGVDFRDYTTCPNSVGEFLTSIAITMTPTL